LNNTLDVDSEVYKSLKIKSFFNEDTQEYEKNAIEEYKRRF